MLIFCFVKLLRFQLIPRIIFLNKMCDESSLMIIECFRYQISNILQLSVYMLGAIILVSIATKRDIKRIDELMDTRYDDHKEQTLMAILIKELFKNSSQC